MIQCHRWPGACGRHSPVVERHMSRMEPTTPPEQGQPAIEVSTSPPAPEAAAPAPSMETPAAHAHDSSWGVALVTLVLLGIVGSIVVIAGLAPTRTPTPVEQRFPL